MCPFRRGTGKKNRDTPPRGPAPAPAPPPGPAISTAPSSGASLRYVRGGDRGSRCPWGAGWTAGGGPSRCAREVTVTDGAGGTASRRLTRPAHHGFRHGALCRGGGPACLCLGACGASTITVPYAVKARAGTMIRLAPPRFRGGQRSCMLPPRADCPAVTYRLPATLSRRWRRDVGSTPGVAGARGRVIACRSAGHAIRMGKF